MRFAVIILAFLTVSVFVASIPVYYDDQAKPVLFSSPGSTDYPWNMFHNTPSRTGVTLASAPSIPALAWTYTTNSLVYPSPVVADGIVFIPSYDGNLYARDEFTGQQKWTYSTGTSIYASPAVIGGRVYFASKNSVVYCLDEKTGSFIWSRSNISPITSSPVVADGKVFYGTWFVKFNSLLLSLNATTGSVVWQYSSDDTIKSSPAVLNGRVFFGQNNGYVLALNETNGSLLWKVGVGTSSISTAPALAYGQVYVGADSLQFSSLDQVTGSVRWSYSIGSFNATSAAVNNGIVYFGTGRGIFYALNATTGAKIWQYPSTGTIGAVSSSPAIALGSNMILFGSSDHNLYALNLTSGGLLWNYLAGGGISSSPAVADNQVFFGSWDTKIYSVVNQAGLSATITASPTRLRPGWVSVVTVNVTNGSAPQIGVSIVMSSSPNGTFGSIVMTSPGVYTSNFTAPALSSTTDTIIQAIVTKPGYIGTSATIVLNPFPALSISIAMSQSTIPPGGDTVLRIAVTNSTKGISGAAIALSSSAGGSFSSLTDFGDGNYSVVFSAPTQTSNLVITARAEKSPFNPGMTSATVSVSGIGNPSSLKISGIPVVAVLALGVFMIFLIMIIMTRRKRSKSGYDSLGNRV